jgi:hypothetical protein
MKTWPIRLAAGAALFVSKALGGDFILGILGLLFIGVEYRRDKALLLRTGNRPPIRRQEELGWLMGALIGVAISTGRAAWQWPPLPAHPDWGFPVSMGAMIGSDMLSAVRRYALRPGEQVALSLIAAGVAVFTVMSIAPNEGGRSVPVLCSLLFAVAAALLLTHSWAGRPGPNSVAPG